MKRINPYTRLLQEIREFVSSIEYRHRKTMFIYPIADLNKGSSWKLSDLYERAFAAEQLGYDVQIKAEEHGLIVQYVKKIPQTPYLWD
jgi:hypothetical protein